MQKTILLVDDDADVRAICGSILEECGFSVLLARDADEALAIFSRDKFDAVLTDVMMPGTMNGFQLARRLKELIPGIPVVCASGDFRMKDGCENCDHYIPKPFSLDQIADIFHDLFSGGKRIIEI